MSIKVLSFDVTGDYAHFRKYYSTSSPVTFSVIPPTAVLGIIGAVLGLPREEELYVKILTEAVTGIGIRLLSPVKKTRMGINLINTKSNVWVPKQRREGARTQIKFEFLKEAAYRFYITMEDQELFGRLASTLMEHKCYYTVSLGLSELLADFRFMGVDEFTLEEAGDPVKIVTAVPLNHIRKEGIALTPDRRYIKERMPFSMNDNREVQEYGELLAESQGRSMSLKLTHFWRGAGENISIIRTGGQDCLC
ncbi:MAG: type I-B CRISPR-associated protein Cas5b [bacterium]|nr:type I-B CRISPR-associated protein Cas5b [bacterium]